jgi:hypothetical protein
MQFIDAIHEKGLHSTVSEWKCIWKGRIMRLWILHVWLIDRAHIAQLLHLLLGHWHFSWKYTNINIINQLFVKKFLISIFNQMYIRRTSQDKIRSLVSFCRFSIRAFTLRWTSLIVKEIFNFMILWHDSMNKLDTFWNSNHLWFPHWCFLGLRCDGWCLWSC